MGRSPSVADDSTRAPSAYRPGEPSTISGITAPAAAPTIKAGFPAPIAETSKPASEPMPAPITIAMIRFAIVPN